MGMTRVYARHQFLATRVYVQIPASDSSVLPGRNGLS